MAVPAPGGTDLPTLLKSMSPTLHPSTFVWTTLEGDLQHPKDQQALPHAELLFREAEGYTLILPEAVAQVLDLDHTFRCRKVTLNVHSSLEASGFIAAVATRLAGMEMGCNCVAGYYHDHVFVPVGKEEFVLQELRAMALEQQ
ncbi:hypothetical protein LTR29_000503 [Friedmanniomyces endolithicus]|nr:hypothetical protein LTR29_000503 [Friedmanniomyces endolithicus]